MTTFSDSSPFKVVVLPKTNPGKLVGEIEIPKRAVITSAAFNVSAVDSANYEFPMEIYLDLGDDSDYEWAFIGDGYGQLGQQRHFLNNETRMHLGFTGVDINKTARFRLPKNASVVSTEMVIDGRLNVSGADPSASWNQMKTYSSSKVAAKTDDGKIYFARESNRYFDIYDPSSNSWSVSSWCKDPFVVRGHGIAHAGSEIFIETSNWSGSSWDYKLFSYGIENNTWTDYGNLPTVNGMVYGGLTYDQNDTLYAVQNLWSSSSSVAFYKYIISQRKWTKLASPKTTICAYPTLCYLDNRVYLMNYTWGGFGTHFQFYAPKNNSWFRLNASPKGIISSLCTDGYNIFGSDSVGEILKYDVLTDTWVITGQSTSSFLQWTAGLTYSDRIFYLARYRPSGGYYKKPGDDGTIFPLDPRLDIGDTGGPPWEWNITGDFDYKDYVNDFSSELNTLLSGTPTSYVDAYGNEFVDITINVSSNRTSEFTIKKMFINYSYVEVVDYNPYTGKLLNAINELVPDVGEGNISIPLVVYSNSKGSVKISNITIDYYIPDLTNDRLELLTGHGPYSKIIYADYMNYTFLVNLTNVAGHKDVESVTLHLDAMGENIQLQWDENTDTFSELFDPNDMVSLDVLNCNSVNNSVDHWTLNFTVRFNWTYPSDIPQVCALNTTNESNAFKFDYVEDVFIVENDLDLIGSLEVLAKDQGVLTSGDWVHANELINWSNLTVVYEGTNDIYPDDRNFDITIYHNATNKWVNVSSSGNTFNLQTQSKAATDINDIHYINITAIPGFGEDVSNISFIVRTDADGPFAPPNVVCHADTQIDWNTDYDNDTQIFVTWDDATDGFGCGVDYYAMEFNNPNPTTISTTGNSALGAEGLATFFVRARDKVGNWGVTGSSSIFIDLTNLTYTNPTPSNTIWQTNRTVACGITIQDIAGTGINVSTIQYRYVESGDIIGPWLDYTGPGTNGEVVVCRQNITFLDDGEDKKVQWHARDFARHYLVESEPPQSIMIDTIPTTIDYITPDFNTWLNTLTPELQFYINDTNGSGVNASSIEYSTSTTGLDGFTGWQQLTGSGSQNSIKLSVTPTFIEGSQNYLRVRAADIAGNIIIFEPKQVLVDISGLEFLNPNPSPTAWSSAATISCNITIRDQVSAIDVTSVQYSYSTNGTDNFAVWEEVKVDNIQSQADGKSVIATAEIQFNDGANNYIRWSAEDLVGTHVVSENYRVQIDINPIRFENTLPSSKDWFNSVYVQCNIIMNDTLGSGVVVDTIEYSISTSGVKGFNDWTKLGLSIQESIGSSVVIFELVHAEVTPQFVAGTENYIRWRVEDLVGNLAISTPLKISIDLDPITFSDPEPREDKVHEEFTLKCKIVVDDLGGSGVDPDSVEYRYSNTGVTGFTKWSSLVHSHGKYIYYVNLTFNPGNENYLQWRAMDIAGNGPFESDIYKISINNPPVVRIDSPAANKEFTNSDVILFNASSTYDPDKDDVLSFRWESNVSGFLGDKKIFNRNLDLGVHNITLSVADSHGKIVNLSIEIKIIDFFIDTDNDKTPDHIDTDDDNDNIPDDQDEFPNDPDEWVDTDGDGLGNNEDDDDDNDDHPDAEDDYPLDDTRWKQEEDKKEEDNNVIYLLILIIVIVVILAVAGAVVSKRKKKREAELVGTAPGQVSEGVTAQATTDGTLIPPTSPSLPTSLGTTTVPLLPPGTAASETQQTYIPPPSMQPQPASQSQVTQYQLSEPMLSTPAEAVTQEPYPEPSQPSPTTTTAVSPEPQTSQEPSRAEQYAEQPSSIDPESEAKTETQAGESPPAKSSRPGLTPEQQKTTGKVQNEETDM